MINKGYDERRLTPEDRKILEDANMFEKKRVELDPENNPHSRKCKIGGSTVESKEKFVIV